MPSASASSELLLLKKRKREGALSQNKKQKRVVFQGFKSRLADISIKNASFDVSVNSSSSSLQETATRETLRRVKSVNISEDFSLFYEDVLNYCSSLPILLHNLNAFVDAALSHLATKSHATGGILEVLAGLAKDTREALVSQFPRIVDVVIGNLLQENLEDTELIEDCFQCLAHLFRFLAKYLSLSQCIGLFFNDKIVLRRKSFLRQFAAEALSLLLVRLASSKGAAEAVDVVMSFIRANPSSEPAAAKDFAAALFLETMRSKVEGSWHSTAHDLFAAVLHNFDPEIVGNLIEKIRISIGFPAMLEEFGDEFIVAISDHVVPMTDLLVSVFLPSHRPKKEDDVKKVDAFVEKLVNSADCPVQSVDLLLRLASLSRTLVNSHAQKLLQWEALGLTATARVLSEVPFPRDLAGFDEAVQLLKTAVTSPSEERVVAARCLAQLEESIEASDAVITQAELSETAEASEAYWRLLASSSSKPASLVEAAHRFVAAKTSESGGLEWHAAVASALRCLSAVPLSSCTVVSSKWWSSGPVMEALAQLTQTVADADFRSQLTEVLLKADDVAVRVAVLKLLQESALETLERCEVSIEGERSRSALVLRVSESLATDAAVLTLLAQFRVPLAPVWEKASEALSVLASESGLVWQWLRRRLEYLSLDAADSGAEICGGDFRSTDRRTEQQSLWKLIRRASAQFRLDEEQRSWLWSRVRAMASGEFDGVVLAAALDAVSGLEAGSSSADRDTVVYLAREKLLASWEADVAAAAVRLLVRDSAALTPFGAELENLAAATNQSVFRRALEAFPMDKEELMVDEAVLRVVFRILFGKLNRRVKGLDKRGNIHTRRAFIFNYLGQVQESKMWLLCEVVLQGLVGSCAVDWRSCAEQELSGLPAAVWAPERKSFTVPGVSGETVPLLNGECGRGVRLAVLESLEQILVGVRMKLRSVAGVLLQALVSLAAQAFADDDWGCFRQSTKTLADYIRVFGADETPAVEHAVRPLLETLAEGLVRSKDARDVSASVSVLVELSKFDETFMDLLETGEAECGLFHKFVDIRDYGSDAGKAVCESLLRFCGVALPSEEGSAARATYGDAFTERRRRWKQSRQEQDWLEEADQPSSGMEVEEERRVYRLLARPDVLSTVLEKLETLLTVKGSVEAIRVLECLARHCLTEAFDASVAERMLLLLAGCGSGGWLRGETLMQSLKTVRALWNRTARSASVRDSVVQRLAPFLSDAKVLDLTGRQELALTLAAVLESELGSILVKLNKLMTGVATVQPDTDAHVVAYHRVTDDLLAADVSQGGLLVARHSLFVLGVAEADFAVRSSAERVLASLAGICADKMKTGVVLDGLYKLMLAPDDLVQKSAMKTLEVWVRMGALGETHADLKRYCLAEETSVLAELYDMQRHRRGRALARLLEDVEQLESLSLEKVVMPVAFHNILQRGVSKSSYDPNMAETSIGLVAALVRKMDSKSPLGIFKLVTHQFMPRYPEREKMLIKCIRAMSDALKTRPDLDQASTEHAINVKPLLDSLKNLVSVRVALARKTQGEETTTTTGAGSSSNGGNSNNQQGGFMVKVRADMVAAVTSLVSLLTDARAREEMVERLAVTCIQGLAARELDLRGAARDGLVSCGLVDQTRAAWMIRTMRARLVRGGYQTPVCVYSVHFLLSKLQRVEADEALVKEVLEVVKMDDERWWSQQSSHDTAVENAKKTEGKQQVLEAKHNKLNVLLELVSERLTDDRQRLNLFDLLYADAFTSKWLFTATPGQQQRFFRRVESQLHHVLKGRRSCELAAGAERGAGSLFQMMLAEGVRLLKTRGKRGEVRKLFDDRAATADSSDSEADDGKKKQQTFVKKNEERFLVAPGAATGRRATPAGTKATVESFSSVVFRGRTLALFALRELTRDLKTATACAAAGVGQLVVDAIVASGAEEVIVAGSKLLGRLVAASGASETKQQQQLFSSKTQKQQLIKLLLNFVQSDAQGSAAGRTVQLAAKASVGVTCTKLLVSLLEKNEDFASDSALVEAVAAHVLAIVDRAVGSTGGGLETLAALQLYKKVVLGLYAKKELRSASCYEIGDKVGELVVVASDKRVAGLAGHVYAQYLATLEHTEGALVKRVGTLVKHMMETDDLSRQNCINALFMYVSALRGKTQIKFFEDKFASLVFLSAVAQLGVEKHRLNISMLQTLITTIVAKVDRNVSAKILSQVFAWPKNAALKPQLHVAALHVALVLSKDESEIFSLAQDLIAKKDATLTLPLLGAINTISSSGCPGPIVDFVFASATSSDDLAVVASALLAATKLPLTLAQKNSLVRKCLHLLHHETQCERAADLTQALLKVLACCTAEVIPDAELSDQEEPEPEEAAAEEDEEEEDSNDGASSASGEEEAVATSRELGLLGAAVEEEDVLLSEEASAVKGTTRLWLLTRVSFLARTLLQRPSEAAVRLGALVKLAVVLCEESEAETLKPVLSLLVRLATMRIFRKEEISDNTNVETIAGLISVPHTQRIGCVVKLAADGLEAVERKFKREGKSAEFARTLSEVRMAIMKTRTNRKLDMKTMPVRAPQQYAQLKLKKAENKKLRKKIKRVDFISSKRKLQL